MSAPPNRSVAKNQAALSAALAKSREAARDLASDDASTSSASSAAVAARRAYDGELVRAGAGALATSRAIVQRCDNVIREETTAPTTIDASSVGYYSRMPRKQQMSATSTYALFWRQALSHMFPEAALAARFAAAATTTTAAAATSANQDGGGGGVARLLSYETDEAEQMLARAMKRLTVSTRRHEESMLRTAAANEPDCSNGDTCWGRRLIIGGTQVGGGGGATLVAYCSEADFSAYTEAMQRATADTESAARRDEKDGLCLLCLRFFACQHGIAQRVNGVRDAIASYVAAKHYNLVDEPGEYPLRYCFGPSQARYTGLIKPMVMPQLLGWRRELDAATNITYFRQPIPIVVDPHASGDDAPPPSPPTEPEPHLRF